MDMTRSMLSPTGLPDKFWGYAFLAANHIRNIVPTKGTKDYISPFQALTGKVPDVSMLRIFGCVATSKIYNQPKLANQSERSMLIGYNHSKGNLNQSTYKLLSLERPWVILDRASVQFQEHNMKGWSTKLWKENEKSALDKVPDNSPQEEIKQAPPRADKPAPEHVPRQSVRQKEILQNSQRKKVEFHLPNADTDDSIPVFAIEHDIDDENSEPVTVDLYEPRTLRQAQQCSDSAKWQSLDAGRIALSGRERILGIG